MKYNPRTTLGTVPFPTGARRITGCPTLTRAMPGIRELARDLMRHDKPGTTEDVEKRAMALLLTWREQGFTDDAINSLRWIYSTLPRRAPRKPATISCLPPQPAILSKTRLAELQAKQAKGQKWTRRSKRRTGTALSAVNSEQVAASASTKPEIVRC